MSYPHDWLGFAQDLTGQAFNKWTVLRFSNRTNGKLYWLCRCACGLEKAIETYNLTSGRSRACRKCSANAFVAPKVTKHGASHSDLYRLWSAIKQRCYNPKQGHSFQYYGALGVTMYEGWRDDFAAFAAYVESAIGPRPSPSHSIDRHPNKDGNYEPGNIRWATNAEQMNNRRWLTHEAKVGRFMKTLCGDE